MTDKEVAFMFRWWCCLAPLELGVLGVCVLEYASLLGFIPKAMFDAAWVSLGGTVDDERYKVFLVLYPLTLETLHPPDAPDVEVYMFNFDWWFFFYWFSGLPEFLCPQGCVIRQYSNP